MTFDHTALITADSNAFFEAAAGNLDKPVPTCPGWTMADLVDHLAEVHWSWATVVEGPLTDRAVIVAIDRPERVPDDQLIDNGRAQTARLVRVLGAADPAAPCWTWAPAQQDCGFVIRHQAQEAAVHRWDAQHAVGAAQPIDRDGALDAIEEFLTFSVSSAADHPDEPGPDLTAPLVLCATDADASWLVRRGELPGTVVAERGDRPEAARVGGTASDLLLWLYDRVELPAEGPGAAATVATFRGLTDTE